MLLPKEIEQGGDFCFGPHRSRETKEVRFVADITIKAGQPYLDVALALDNAVKDHRLKLMIPTHTGGKYYFSSACFGFNKREIGLDVSKQDYQQPELSLNRMKRMAADSLLSAEEACMNVRYTMMQTVPSALLFCGALCMYIAVIPTVMVSF